jgi:hypothetical protein
VKYFGIKTPEKEDKWSKTPSIIWWIANDEHSSWMLFFQYPSNKNELMPYRLPIAEAIQAYKAIGYKCVELEVKEK